MNDMTIGERLEEARKRKGISIREAAEATKIRGEFLLNMENNSFNIPLPDVYVRGFLKNYCVLLGVDVVMIMTDFDAMQLATVKDSKREKGEFLGRMDIPDTELESEPPKMEAASKDDRLARDYTDKTLYTNMLIIFVAVFAAVFVVVMITNYFINRGDKTEINPELMEVQAGDSGTGSVDRAGPADEQMNALVEEEIILIAIDDVTVIVDQRIDSKRLFSGTMRKDQTVPLKKIGPIKVSFTEGRNLIVQGEDGSRFEMGVAGVGTSTLD